MKMSKKLRRVWINCLRMWKWISEEVVRTGIKPNRNRINALKAQWLKENRFTRKLAKNCFFCQWLKEHPSGQGVMYCDNCPGRQAVSIWSCWDEGYTFDGEPGKFYNRLKKIFAKLEKEDE